MSGGQVRGVCPWSHTDGVKSLLSSQLGALVGHSAPLNPFTCPYKGRMANSTSWGQ